MNTCGLCRESQAPYSCGLCRRPLCKECEEYLEINSFSFQEKTPEEFTRGHYCPPCFEETLRPALDRYEAMMEQAKRVYIFFATSPLPFSLVKKANKGIKINACRDRDETFLRLGFRAVEQGYNGVVQVEVERGQPRNIWNGRGIPAHIDAAKQARNEYD